MPSHSAKAHLRLATWNINSVRRRISLLAALAEEGGADIVCLQETKVQDDSFPRAAAEALGYRHIAVNGMKSYNGVAILSRLPFERIECRGWCDKEDARHVAVEIDGGGALGHFELHNFYVPAGGDVPDPETNQKFAHKLQFLTEVSNWFSARKRASNRLIITGDLNVAPLETDVWSHRQLLKVVSHTPVEVEHMQRLARSHDWVDAVRHFVPAEQKLFSWWSYRSRDWSESDRGRRLDHVWVTPALVDRLAGAQILRDARDWPSPSDHVPVMIDLGR